MKPGELRSRFWRHAARTLVAAGVALGLAAIVGDRTGLGWVVGPAASGALGALLSAFALLANLPPVTEEAVTNIASVQGDSADTG